MQHLHIPHGGWGAFMLHLEHVSARAMRNAKIVLCRASHIALGVDCPSQTSFRKRGEELIKDTMFQS
eukprot:6214583-Pleurochrysis_carterae.AAC.2